MLFEFMQWGEIHLGFVFHWFQRLLFLSWSSEKYFGLWIKRDEVCFVLCLWL